MDIYFYNTLTRRKEKFEPLTPGEVKMYSCGPTVYRYVHIGNLRTFLMADLVRRVLEYHGYRVTQLMNITDVGHMAEDDSLTITPGEDKVLAAAAAEKKTPRGIADFYTADFLDCVRQMNIQPAHVYPKATEHIPQMLTLIEQLETKGLAYEKGGAVFFDVSRFPDYGRLSGHALEDLQAGIHRVGVDETKDDPNDFLLWRVAGEHRTVKWDSKWGPGFPGWHIECSAMSMHYLGPQLDLHTGGEDLVFPHHEDEIAQSEGATGQAFVRYWMHGAHLLAEGRKMARSVGNVLRLKDLREEGYDPLAFRLLCLGIYYRGHMNVTWDSLKAAQSNLDRLRRYVAEWSRQTPVASPQSSVANLQSPSALDYHTRFVSAVSDDLGFPQAVPILWEMAKSDLAPGQKLNLLLDWDRLLGLDLVSALSAPTAALEPELQAVLDQRAAARAAKDWAASDRLRDELAARGIVVKDGKDGQTWTRK
ncbi:MAG TPA: cysteine--tRNA ligase [Anaerolineales bacterium]|nr:cysteine--tRNA ligase [Anaerolineales bacterium]